MSARQITKEVANKVANLLVEKKKQQITKLKTELNNLYEVLISKQIPSEVMLLWENPNTRGYITSSSYFYLDGDGLGKWFQVRLEHNLPSNNNHISVTNEDSTEVLKKLKSIDVLEKEVSDIRLKFETAIYNLRSYSRIEKEFPEAYVLIPREEGVNLPSINLGEIRELAKNIQ